MKLTTKQIELLVWLLKEIITVLVNLKHNKKNGKVQLDDESD